MAKPWGGVGAWALDAEREDEEREHAAAFPAPDPPAAAGGAASFPSLKEAVVEEPEAPLSITAGRDGGRKLEKEEDAGSEALSRSL